MKWSRLILLLCLGAAMALAACGDDDEEPASNGASTVQEEPAEKPAATADAPATTPPGEIQVTDALPKAPPEGKKVIFLQCELPSCARYTPAMKEATGSLGWSFDSQVFKNTGTGPAGALDQAIAQKPDYIAITGIPAAALKPQLKKAADAKIPVVSGAVPEEPSEGTWVTQVGGTLVPDAENVGKWIAQDSGGKANVVGVTIPQFPVLKQQVGWFADDFKTVCPDCKYDQLDVTVEEVGAGGVPQKLVGYLQSHPDVDYVFFSFSDLGKGVGKVLEGSDLRDKVKLTGCCGDAGNAKEIASGDTDAWTISPNEYGAWAMVDAMARLSVGEDPGAQADKVMGSPTWVVDSPESVDKNLKVTNFDWPGPAGYQDQWKELWQVGA